MGEKNLFKELDSAIDAQLDKKIKTASTSTEEKKVTGMDIASLIDENKSIKKAGHEPEVKEGFEDVGFDNLGEIFKDTESYTKIAENALEVLNSELREFTKEASINVTDTVRESTLAKAAWALKSAAQEIEGFKKDIKVAARVKKLVSNSIFTDEDHAEKYVKSASDRLSGDDVAIDKHLDNLVIAKETDFSSDLSKEAGVTDGNSVDDFLALVKGELD